MYMQWPMAKQINLLQCQCSKFQRCRKAYLHLACGGNHLAGIGGPAAPHVFAFDKRKDLEGMLGKTIDGAFFCCRS